jgi:serine/tyrosine/threonine adenylyltransferase
LRDTIETGAIVCRVAETWIRFGSFEILYARGDIENLRKLADYTTTTHFGLKEGEYMQFIDAVVEKTADMVLTTDSRLQDGRRSVFATV